MKDMGAKKQEKRQKDPVMGTLDRNTVLRGCHTAALNDGCERSQLCKGFDQPSKAASHHPSPYWKLTRVIKSHSPCFQPQAAPIISGLFSSPGTQFPTPEVLFPFLQRCYCV